MVGHHSHSDRNNKPHRRCEHEKCNKLAKDNFQGTFLCRIHSPYRKAFEEKLKKESKKR